MTTSIDKKHRYDKKQLVSMFSLAPSHPVDWPYAGFLAEKSGNGQPIKAREPQQYQQPKHYQEQEKQPHAAGNPGTTQKSAGTSNDWRQSTNTGHQNQGSNATGSSGMNRNPHSHSAHANGGGGNTGGGGGGYMTAEQQRKMFENERRQIEQERENKSKGGDSSSANLLSPEKPNTSLFHDETDNLMKELAGNNNKQPLSPAGTKKISLNSLFGSPSAMKVQTDIAVTSTVADDGSGIMGGLGSLPALPGIWSQSSVLGNSMPTVGSPNSKRSHNKFSALTNDDNDFDDVDFSGLIEKMIFDEDLDGGGGGGDNGSNMGLGSSRFGGLGFNVKDIVDPLPINASSELSPSTSSKQLHVGGLLGGSSTPSGVEELSGIQSNATDSGGKSSASFDVLSKLGFQSPTSPLPSSHPQQQQIHQQPQHPQHPHHQQLPQQPPMYNNLPPQHFPHSPMMMDPRLMPPYGGGGSPPPHMGHMPPQHYPGQSPGGPVNYGGMPHHPPPWMGMRPPIVPHHPHSPAAFAHQHPRGMPSPYHPSHYPPRPLHPGQHPQQFAPPGGMMMSPPLPEGMPPPQPQQQQQHQQHQQQPSPRPPAPVPVPATAPSNQFTFHIHNAGSRGISKGGVISASQPPSTDALVTPNGGSTPSQNTISSSGTKLTQSSPIMSASARQLMKMLKVPATTKANNKVVVASSEVATINSIAETNTVIISSSVTPNDKSDGPERSTNPTEAPQALQRINVSDLFKKKSTTDVAIDK